MRYSIVLSLLVAACSSAHGPDPMDGGRACMGPAPRCAVSPSAYCCDYEMPRVNAVCDDGAWACPDGHLNEDQCAYELRGGRCIGGPIQDASVREPDYTSCMEPSECVLTATSCCGTCDRPTTNDVHAVRLDRVDDYYLDIICPEARTEPPICPGCAAAPNPNLLATCGSTGRCEVIDVENDPRLSGCAVDADCMLRLPQCCECGVGSSIHDVVAIRADREAELAMRLCSGDALCPDCAPSFDPSLRAACVDNACQVVSD